MHDPKRSESAIRVKDRAKPITFRDKKEIDPPTLTAVWIGSRSFEKINAEETFSRLTGVKSRIDLAAFLVTIALVILHNSAATLALANPFSSADYGLATWFHQRLSPAFVGVLRAFTDLGCAEWIGVVLFALVVFFAWKRWWPSLVTLIIAVPGGMLLNEGIKVLVHRHRPFVDGPFVDWSGYSFASGHTIGATLLYGQLLLFILPALKARHWRLLCIFSAMSLVLLVGFSRIALGAHFLTDVLAAIFFGALWLMLCLFTGKSVRKHRHLPESLPVGSEVVVLGMEQPAQLVPIRAISHPHHRRA